jgi:uncharacterized repeat protein (TIGR03803 family)
MTIFSRRAGAFPIYLAMPIMLAAQTFTTLVRLDHGNGGFPYAPVVQGIDGNLYGATLGAQGATPARAFRLTLGGALTALGSLGKTQPFAGLGQDTDGNLYGTTNTGGADQTGRIYEITPAGMVKYIFTFPRNGAKGSNPMAGLIQATDTKLYGTAGDGANNAGVVFKYTPGAAETVLYNFCSQPNCSDGLGPDAKLLEAADGNFFGTTTGVPPPPNTGVCQSDCGTVFKLTPGGVLTTLYTFCSQPNCSDGSNPLAELIQASDGNLYGTTWEGGNAAACSGHGCGTVFRITPSGALNTIHTFCSVTGCVDGLEPTSGLIQATDGNLYGTTTGGGTQDKGSIFRITLSGGFETVYSFCEQRHCPDGSHPDASLIQATDGNLYGTAFGNSGQPQYGTVFRLSLGLAPFVKTLQAAGASGAPVTILGNNLTVATSVTFNGTPAPSFTVNSTGSAITTAVPPEATTGSIQVTLADGTVLSSNVPFQVP